MLPPLALPCHVGTASALARTTVTMPLNACQNNCAGALACQHAKTQAATPWQVLPVNRSPTAPFLPFHGQRLVHIFAFLQHAVLKLRRPTSKQALFTAPLKRWLPLQVRASTAASRLIVHAADGFLPLAAVLLLLRSLGCCRAAAAWHAQLEAAGRALAKNAQHLTLRQVGKSRALLMLLPSCWLP